MTGPPSLFRCIFVLAYFLYVIGWLERFSTVTLRLLLFHVEHTDGFVVFGFDQVICMSRAPLLNGVWRIGQAPFFVSLHFLFSITCLCNTLQFGECTALCSRKKQK